MKNYLATPKNSVFIAPELLKNKHLSKYGSKRVTSALIYGILRNKFNLSLNNPDDYYSKDLHNIYCVAQIPTLMKLSGLGRNSVEGALLALSRQDYIFAPFNHHRHVKFIFLPRLTNKLINSNNLGVSLQSKLSTFAIQTNVSLQSKLRCRYKNNNNKKVTTYNSKTPKIPKFAKNNHNQKMINYIKNYDYPVEVNNLLIYRFSYDKARDIASRISNIKVSVNKHYGVYSYRNMLYNNKTNQYIQHSSGLYQSLRKAINDHKDIITVVSNDYEAFIKHYLATAQHNQHYSTRTVIKQKLPKWARDDYHVKLHPTSKAMQKKIQKQLKDLNSGHRSIIK